MIIFLIRVDLLGVVFVTANINVAGTDVVVVVVVVGVITVTVCKLDRVLAIPIAFFCFGDSRPTHTPVLTQCSRVICKRPKVRDHPRGYFKIRRMISAEEG